MSTSGGHADSFCLSNFETKKMNTIHLKMLGDIGNKKRDRAPGTKRSKDGGKTVSWLELVRGGGQKAIRR